MSGDQVPYHLRFNKAVDRSIFLELLSRVHAARSLFGYTYIGFGGPYLEDHRQIHNQFGLEHLISIEANENVVARQQRSLPLSCIQCLHKTSGDFVSQYAEEGNAVIWLDYADPKAVREQLQEVEALLLRLKAYDVLKVTLNANVQTLGDKQIAEPELRKQRWEVLRARLGDYLPAACTIEDVRPSTYPQLLLRALQRVARRVGVDSGRHEVRAVVVTSFSYTDLFHRMLTVSLVVLPRGKTTSFLNQTGIRKWSLRLPSNNAPIEINIPALSARERMALDPLLPSGTASRLSSRMGFECGRDRESSLAMLRSYKKFYRHLPLFTRVVL